MVLADPWVVDFLISQVWFSFLGKYLESIDIFLGGMGDEAGTEGTGGAGATDTNDLD